MANADNIGGKELDSFFASWSRHPLSIFVIMTLLPMSFMFLLFHNAAITKEQLPLLVYSTYGFSAAVLLLVSLILIIKKQALYNALDVLSNEIAQHIHILGESLENIEIGLIEEPYEDLLELLCPMTAKNPISEEAKQNVHVFEFLVDIEKDCGIKVEVKDEIRLKLAKFYYKNQKFDKALDCIRKIEAYHFFRVRAELKAETLFCKGLILKKAGRKNESSEAFQNAIKAKADFKYVHCWACMPNADSKDKTEIEKFIKHAENSCNKACLTKHCINILATAYYNQAKLFPSNTASVSENMRNALKYIDIAINNFGSWAAYYNKACLLCVIARSTLVSCADIDIYCEDKQTNDNITAYDIISCLEKAFAERPALAVYSKTDVDLTWIKEKYPNEFYALLGRVYDKNHRILCTEG
jgi:tetratricopeptide (TPR) repeat protein